VYGDFEFAARSLVDILGELLDVFGVEIRCGVAGGHVPFLLRNSLAAERESGCSKTCYCPTLVVNHGDLRLGLEVRQGTLLSLSGGQRHHYIGNLPTFCCYRLPLSLALR